MTFNDLLEKQGIDPGAVLALRHRPHEPMVRRNLPWLAEERPHVFNAYQQGQTPKVEAAIQRSSHVASFIGLEPGTGHFAGLYQVRGAKRVTRDQFWKIPGNADLLKLGMKGFSAESPRKAVLWFDLRLTEFYGDWKGRLVVSWPPPERSWWRRAHRNDLRVLAVLGESVFRVAMPAWRDVDLSWAELQRLPGSWEAALRQWRGVYFIFDESDGKGYVGSACGEQNILGRWSNYAARGDGGNRMLRGRNPETFRFSILERASPDMPVDEIVAMEQSWKARLHTRAPHGLNLN